MTELSKKILADYQVRKTKPQKLAFIDFIKQNIPGAVVEEGGFHKNRNIIVGDVEHAKVIFTAHYDTCARLPFPNFIMPKNMLLSLLYGLVTAIPFLAIMFLVRALVSAVTDDFLIIYWASMLSFIASFTYVFFLSPANQHTVNDNTSGVITLIELMSALTPAEREQVAFVFFDNEENGLLGSSWFRSKHKAHVKDTLLINFDCVSDGDHIMLVQSKPALKQYGDALKAAFVPLPGKTMHFESSSKAFYPSDQGGYPVGVGVAALKKKPFFGLCLDRIHTKHDTVMDESNIALLTAGAGNFVRGLSKADNSQNIIS